MAKVTRLNYLTRIFLLKRHTASVVLIQFRIKVKWQDIVIVSGNVADAITLPISALPGLIHINLQVIIDCTSCFNKSFFVFSSFRPTADI
jgi:hypothetical protein